MSWLWSLISGLCLLISGIAVLSWVLPLRWQKWIVIATLSPYLELLAIPALLIGALTRQWDAVTTATAVLALLVSQQLPARNRDKHALEGLVLKVLTANVLYRSSTPDALTALVAEHHVDVLMVQELTTPGVDGLRVSGLEDHLPHSFVRPGFGGEGTGLWSKYPLTDTVSQPGFGFEVLSARAQLPDGCRPWLFSVHLEPPWPRPSHSWTVELPRLAALLKSVPGEDSIVAAGDFNATFDHPQFRAMLKGGLQDAGEQTGTRRLLTYPAHRLRPFLGIDHVLLRSATALSARTVAVPGSDHLGVLAEIRLTRSGA